MLLVESKTLLLRAETVYPIFTASTVNFAHGGPGLVYGQFEFVTQSIGVMSLAALLVSCQESREPGEQ